MVGIDDPGRLADEAGSILELAEVRQPAQLVGVGAVQELGAGFVDPPRAQRLGVRERRLGQHLPLEGGDLRRRVAPREFLQARNVLSAEKLSEIEQRVKSTIDEAVEFAMNAPDPRPEEAVEDLYA